MYVCVFVCEWERERQREYGKPAQKYSDDPIVIFCEINYFDCKVEIYNDLIFIPKPYTKNSVNLSFT